MIRKYLSSDRVAVRSKLAQKYDKTAENDVITWIHEITGVKLEAGIYKLGRQIKNGQTLVKLAQKIQQDTPNCPEAAKNFVLKLNTDNAPFKQMENIQVFLGFCERYGVPVSGLFHTKDLFDGNNMQQVLACVIQLGTESQRNHFPGPTLGPKPQEKNIRDFSQEKLKASHSFLAMQGGKSGPALDFQMGAARRIVDSRTEPGFAGTIPEIVNGVPDLLDIGKKGKKNKGKVDESDGGDGSDNESKEEEEEKNGKEGSESSDDEIGNKAKSPPPVKNKPETKDEDNKSEKKTRERKNDNVKEKNEVGEDSKKERKKHSKKQKDREENEDEGEKSEKKSSEKKERAKKDTK